MIEINEDFQEQLEKNIKWIKDNINKKEYKDLISLLKISVNDGSRFLMFKIVELENRIKELEEKLNKEK